MLLPSSKYMWRVQAQGWRGLPLRALTFRRYAPDHPAGVACGEDVFGDVPGYHTAGPDDGAGTDPHAGANYRPAAHPDIRTDLDRLAGLLLTPQQGIHRVGRRVELDSRAKEAVVANPYFTDVEDDAVEVEEDLLAQVDVRAVVTVERGLQPDVFSAPSEQLRKYSSSLDPVGFPGGIEVLTQVPGARSRPDQLRVHGIVRLPRQHLLPLGSHSRSSLSAHARAASIGLTV